MTGVVGTSTAVSELPAGDWSWWLRARDAGGVPGPWSLATSFNTSGRVTGVAASVTASSIPTISWQPIAEAERYTLQVNNLTTGEQQVVRIDLVDSTYTVPTAFASGTYRVWVRAISNDATGPWSLQYDFAVA